MAQKNINIGTNANDGTGDPLRTAFDKINDNFTELFGDTAEANDILDDASPQLGGDLDLNGYKITTARSNENINVDPAGTGTIELLANTNITGHLVASGNITANGNINLGDAAGDQVKVTGVFEADQLQIDGTTLTSTVTNGDVTINGNGTGQVQLNKLTVDGNVQIVDNTIKTTSSNSNLELSASGTGDVIVGAVRVHGTTLSSDDSTKITINEALDVTGTLTVGAGTGVTTILDEDAMGTNSATALATQQSIKAYADTKAVQTGSTNNTVATVTGANAFQGEANLTFDGTTLAITGSESVSGTLTTADIVTTGTHAITGQLDVDGVQIKDNKISASRSNDNLEVSAFGVGVVEVQSAMTTLGQTATGLVTINGELNVDNIGINANGIASINSNGGININPNGTGVVTLGGGFVSVANNLTVNKSIFCNNVLEFGTGSFILQTTSNEDLPIMTQGTGMVRCNDVGFNANKITTYYTNADLILDPNGTGAVSIDTIKVLIPNLPTSDPGVTGQLWNDSNTLKISA